MYGCMHACMYIIGNNYILEWFYMLSKGSKGHTGSTGPKGEVGYQGMKGDKGKANISELKIAYQRQL